MRAARGQEIAPEVLTYIDMPYGNWILFFVVKNIGRTVAKDIKFDFDPPLQSGFGNRIQDFEVSFLKNGISSLAPGQQLRIVFDSITNYFDGPAVKMLDGSLPSVYRVTVTYKGGLQPEMLHSSDQVIDLSMFKDIGVLQEKGEKDLIKAVEALAQSGERIQRSLWTMANALASGIWLKNSTLIIEAPVSSQEEWNLAVIAKLSEFTMLWELIYAGNYKRPIHSHVENLQLRISLLGAHILSLAAKAPQSAAGETKDQLAKIALKLSVLSEARFLMDGEVSEPDFNSTGDEAARLATIVIEKLREGVAPSQRSIEASHPSDS